MCPTASLQLDPWHGAEHARKKERNNSAEQMHTHPVSHAPDDVTEHAKIVNIGAIDKHIKILSFLGLGSCCTPRL